MDGRTGSIGFDLGTGAVERERARSERPEAARARIAAHRMPVSSGDAAEEEPHEVPMALAAFRAKQYTFQNPTLPFPATAAMPSFPRQISAGASVGAAPAAPYDGAGRQLQHSVFTSLNRIGSGSNAHTTAITVRGGAVVPQTRPHVNGTAVEVSLQNGADGTYCPRGSTASAAPLENAAVHTQAAAMAAAYMPAATTLVQGRSVAPAATPYSPFAPSRDPTQAGGYAPQNPRLQEGLQQGLQVASLNNPLEPESMRKRHRPPLCDCVPYSHLENLATVVVENYVRLSLSLLNSLVV